MKKKRLDLILKLQLPDLTRNKIVSLIIQGKVTVDNKIVTKPGFQVNTDAIIKCDLYEPKFVSRAGLKLEKALNYFSIDVKNLVAMDAGISTGGFTDCLLQNGILKVYGVDVAFGQVHEKIRSDPRVILLERTNLRKLESLPEQVDIVTLDLSFISVLKVIPVVKNVLKKCGQLIILIKPQFEAGKDKVGSGGIIKDSKIHEDVIKQVTNEIKSQGFDFIGVIESPILGSSGNKEFLAYFRNLCP